MHTWLPDAHSEAPSLVSALLSGALLNCAWLEILRCHGVLTAAGVGDFSSELLVTFGLLSMAIAAIFVMRQPDFKRLLAYSSVEHMGILAFGAGLGTAGVSASVYHACNHSLTKAALFLTAGNILTYFHTKETHKITGLLRIAPVTGVLWIAGFLSITGAPPFGTFASEIAILRAALIGGSYVPAALYLGLLVVIFIGLARTMLPMAQGRNDDSHTPQAESWLMIVPNAVLLAGVLVLGLGIPPILRNSFETIGRGFQPVAAKLGDVDVSSVDGALGFRESASERQE